MAKTYTLEEVAKHNNEGDCWMVVHDKIYDCTNYLNDHPGGVEIMTDVAGMDATEDYDDVGHSEEADDMLVDLYVGDVGPSSGGSSAAPPAAPPAAAPATPARAAPAPVKAAIKPAPIPPKPAPRQQPGPKKFDDSDDSTAMIVGGVIVAAAVGFLVYKKLA